MICRRVKFSFYSFPNFLWGQELLIVSRKKRVSGWTHETIGCHLGLLDAHLLHCPFASYIVSWELCTLFVPRIFDRKKAFFLLQGVTTSPSSRFCSLSPIKHFYVVLSLRPLQVPIWVFCWLTIDPILTFLSHFYCCFHLSASHSSLRRCRAWSFPTVLPFLLFTNPPSHRYLQSYIQWLLFYFLIEYESSIPPGKGSNRHNLWNWRTKTK